MKLYFYTLIVLILYGLALVGCSGVEDNAETRENNPAITSQDSPSPADNSQKTAADNSRKEVSDETGKAITVYKSPTCGCCTMWEQHLTTAGFKVTSKTTDNMAEIRKQYGVPEKMQSCHTGVIKGYVIEGHVPAGDIEKLLKTRPDVVGLAAPGMPPKSPGMQPEGENPSDYDVLSFDRQGNAKVFTSYK